MVWWSSNGRAKDDSTFCPNSWSCFKDRVRKRQTLADWGSFGVLHRERRPCFPSNCLWEDADLCCVTFAAYPASTFYAASMKVLHPAAQLERASASVMSHLAFILLFAYSLHCCDKQLPVSLCVGGRVLAYIGYIYVPDSFRPRVTQRIKWPVDGWGLIYETTVCGLLPFCSFSFIRYMQHYRLLKRQ